MEERTRAIDLLRTVNRFLRAGDLDIDAVAELTMAQMRVLFRLHNHGAITSGKLAAGLHVTLPTVTSVIDRMIGHGLVERRDDPNDRRRVIVALSKDGEALVERIQQGRRHRLTLLIDALGGEDLHSLVGGLTALTNAIENVNSSERREVTGAGNG